MYGSVMLSRGIQFLAVVTVWSQLKDDKGVSHSLETQW